MNRIKNTTLNINTKYLQQICNIKDAKVFILKLDILDGLEVRE